MTYDPSPTIVLDFSSKPITLQSGDNVKIQIWDTGTINYAVISIISWVRKISFGNKSVTNKPTFIT